MKYIKSTMVGINYLKSMIVCINYLKSMIVCINSTLNVIWYVLITLYRIPWSLHSLSASDLVYEFIPWHTTKSIQVEIVIKSTYEVDTSEELRVHTKWIRR